jgi:hypothetical protein
MKTINFLFAFFLLSLSLSAQNPYPHRCAFDHAVQHADAQYPGFEHNYLELFERAKRMAAEGNFGRSTYTIPLAVHVVWKDSVQNLSECQIIEQVDILNEAYQRLNPDTVNLRPVFDNVVGNPSIFFRLDTIIWKQSTTDFFSGGLLPDIAVSDQVKHDSSGGSDALNTAAYLNIWVCSLGNGGLLGYAYPPAGLSNWPADSEAPTPGDDGVVVDYRTVGRANVYATAQQSINTSGRAGVHEVGHYLGLRHIWGDGLLSILGIPDCSADDGLTDTPNAGIPSNYQCDPAQNTCEAGQPGDLPDMIENFMDYSEETCQNSFTLGQIGIMHGVLNAERDSLLLTPAPAGPSRPNNDAQPHALGLTVNTDGSCNAFASSTNLYASQSMDACAGSTANDVWFSFENSTSGLIVDLSNITATAGSGTAMAYEVFSGSCGNLQSVYCSTNTNDTLSGLSFGTHFIRVYSTDTASSQSFDICLQSYGATVVGTSMVEALAHDVRVYPNPSTGRFTVEIPAHATFNGILEVKNVLGQRISNPVQIDNFASVVELDLSTLDNGMYILEFNVDGERFVKKVVLNK